MSEYGLEIRNIKAATLWGYNHGTRNHYDFTKAMLCNSLFLDFLRAHGLKDWKGRSTRDVICLDFSFGTRSYEEELKHLSSMEQTEKVKNITKNVKKHEKSYKKMSKQELRTEFYVNGVDVPYKEETIHYKMLYRNPSKAKVGQCMFIREELYEAAYDWLTMGLGKRLPEHEAKIVEISAYAPLTTSTIVDKFHMPVEDVLILRDQDSFFRTMAKVVRSEKDGNGKIYCVVDDKEADIKNTLWDGMALIDTNIVPDFVNGMALLRNHFFKACAFRCNIQKFFRDWYGKDDVSSIEVTDMFGVRHKLSNVKMITTDNACKFKKFTDLMGKDPYQYWKDRVNADGSYWGIVKTDHPSKLGEVQQMSYQMVNTLPCDTNDIFELADTSVRYVEKMKNDEEAFVSFLRQNANITNCYNMMADLYDWNHNFADCKWYRSQKRQIINTYINKLKSGKITVNGDNLTVCGNPYALLMYTVGGDWEKDPTLQPEDGCIQCYTTRFNDGEYLCGIRNPHNSPNNISYLHNRRSSIMERYFGDWSPNIMAVNCIHTDVQSRMNGEDFDSDFNFVTNNSVMVRSAEIAYRDYPTIVNDLEESGIKYNNTLKDYARMDNIFASSQRSIGESSNIAQTCLSYYWSEPSEELYDIFVILSVVA